MLYRKLDAERDAAQRSLDTALRETGGTPQERTERDVATSLHSDRLAQLNAVEQGLCFGRIDPHDEQPSYIGRVGLFDDAGDYAPLLLDWRAPAARPFYLATAAAPQGVRRRRHIRTLTRTVVGVDDEVLDLHAGDHGSDLGLAGEAALLAALEQRRTGEMGDIVATIQAEQDRIIRSGLGGVLVVQGGPGTGKTAVALHRAAYLLYTYRQQLTSRGVLVVGPNNTFLRYIGQVLPSLGETGVLTTTVGELFPGVRPRSQDSRAGVSVKGSPVMTDVLAAAVRDRQRVPPHPLEIRVEQDSVWLDPDTCRDARAKAQDSDKPHNLARRVFVDAVLDSLARQLVDRLTGTVLDDLPEIAPTEDEDPDAEVLDDRDVTEMRADLADNENVLSTVDSLWPELTPQRVLGELLTSQDWLDTVAAEYLSVDQRAAILRERPRAWTSADAALLDELAELLGKDDTEQRRQQAHAEREQRAYAEGVLHVLEQDEEIADEEVLRVSDVLDAELLAEREQYREQLTAAQRAAHDREWAFGHVIVDEAQELSPMDWRMLMRRCPSRSMTLVGDVAQTSSPAGAASWGDVLHPYVDDRWRLAELSVNYRTPAEIMDVAARILAEVAPHQRVPRSVRETGVPPRLRQMETADLVDLLPAAVEDELSAADGGTVAVLCLASMVDRLRTELAHVATDRLTVLSVHEAKGLEFDAVVLVAPADIVDGSERGAHDLYVALTRATQRLLIVSTGRVLPALSGLDDSAMAAG